MTQRTIPAAILLARHWLPLLLTALTLLALLLEPVASGWLRYEREAVDAGELWRLLSANLVHLGWLHWLLNLAGLWLIWWIFEEDLGNRAWLLWILLLFVANIIALHLLSKGLGFYVGMSGALHGLIAGLAVLEWRRGLKLSGLLLLGVFAKVAWEQWFGTSNAWAGWLGGQIITDAHWYGFWQGLVLGLLWSFRRSPSRPALSAGGDQAPTRTPE